MGKAAVDLETRFVNAVRRPCKFPGCSKLLSKYNNTDNDWCHSHTIKEVQIERKPGCVPVCKAAQPVFVPLPTMLVKKELPKELKPFSPDTPVYMRILLASCFHFKTSLEELHKMDGDRPKRRQRMVVMYLLTRHTDLGKATIARFLRRTHNTAVRDAVMGVRRYMSNHAADLKAIRAYCGIKDHAEEVQQMEAAE